MKDVFNSGTKKEKFEPKIGDRVLVTRLSDYQFPVVIEDSMVVPEKSIAFFRSVHPGCQVGDKIYSGQVDGRTYEFHESKLVGPAPAVSSATPAIPPRPKSR